MLYFNKQNLKVDFLAYNIRVLSAGPHYYHQTMSLKREELRDNMVVMLQGIKSKVEYFNGQIDISSNFNEELFVLY